MGVTGGSRTDATKQTGGGQRDVGFDIARAVFMVLGIVSHAAVIYREGDPWRVSADTSHIAFTWITDFMRAFRMYAFYVIAGYFFALSAHRTSANEAVRHRITRLGVPLVFIGFTANGVMHALSTYVDHDLTWFEYVTRGVWLGPLWFIGNLLVYCALWAVVDRAVRRCSLPATPTALHLTAIMALTPIASSALSAIGNRICASTLVFVSLPQLYEFAAFFALGAFVETRPAWFAELVRLRRAGSVLVLALLAVAIASKLGLEERSYSAMLVVRQFLHLALALAILGLFRGITTAPRWVRRMTSAAYTVYVLHAPCVVALYVVLEPLQLGMATTFLTICVVTLSVTLWIHEHVVARFALAELLVNGVLPRRRARRAAPA